MLWFYVVVLSCGSMSGYFCDKFLFKKSVGSFSDPLNIAFLLIDSLRLSFFFPNCINSVCSFLYTRFLKYRSVLMKVHISVVGQESLVIRVFKGGLP